MAVSVEPSPTAAGAGFRVDARAKVNLFLHVTGRRGDGYHELESLVAFAAICDRIEVRPAERLEFETDGPFAAKLDPRAENLAVRAARALAEAAGIAPDARIRLHKALPVAAGLGGGSADAAAVLRALAALWDVTLPGEALAALALRLGADVPVCLAARPSMMRGIGERIEAAPALPAAPILLVNPAVPLATAAVFAAREGPFSKPRRFDAAPPTSRRSPRRSARPATISPPAPGVSARTSTRCSRSDRDISLLPARAPHRQRADLFRAVSRAGPRRSGRRPDRRRPAPLVGALDAAPPVVARGERYCGSESLNLWCLRSAGGA